MSDRKTYVIFFIFTMLILLVISILNKKVNIILKRIKHYSSSELMKEFVINQRSYCCLRHKIINNASAILFIGDSHIEQYIIAIFNSAYRNKYLLIHIYVHSLDYNNMLQKKFF